MSYRTTETQYPSSSSSKRGYAWAYDVSDGTWKWTTKPMPFSDQDSVFRNPPSMNKKTPVKSKPSLVPCEKGKERNPATNRCRTIKPKTKQPTPCKPGQVRNPETNRCRSAVSASKSLAPCKPGQIRNPETNRCKNAVLASKSLTPCKPGQVRNPETNRCRSVLSASKKLKPCAPGQERNPETNRCRKVASHTGPRAAFAVEPIQDTSEAVIGWWAFGGVGLLALGYAGWEWRHEISRLIRRVRGQ